ncbi:alkaline phosphatase D family protein [Maricaulaceae bacterium EIL42A08]|nr:alkaline phosphatase D family protein [Maricaulaceae bacterium EIL42A08]
MQNEMKLTRRAALLAGVGATAALGACSEPSFAPLGQPDGPFKHGVASGDPDQTSVMLWTAVTGDEGAPVTVELAADEAFEDFMYEAEAGPAGPPTNGATPYKILIEGLQPAQRIYYRFRYREMDSQVGTTTTLPDGAVDEFRIAAFSCSNYPAGFFNSYRHAAERGDVDLAVHLGDYLYEYAADGYASEDAERLSRVVDPAHEIVTYDDYARRHAQYSSDPDLQALKAAVPMLLIWDDHETANNATRDGAENHNEGEGDWITRRDEALRAWQAWTPTRERTPMHERWGSLDIGDLARLIFIETRLTARSEEILLDPFPVDPSTADPEDPENRRIVAEWLEATAGAEDRTLLGPEQLAFVEAALGESVANGQPWRIFANQVIMGRVPAPNYPKVMPFWLRWAVQSSDPLAWSYIQRFAFGTPFNLDAWDGYPAERERLFQAARGANADFITLTGDTHNAWAIDLKTDEGTRVGTEFGVTSVSSPSRFERLELPGVDFGVYTEEAAPDVMRHNAYDRGYLHLTLTRDEARAELMVVDTCKSRNFNAYPDSVWRVRPASGGAVPQAERIS